MNWVERHFEYLRQENEKLEKALDKACEFLGYNFDCPYATLNKCILEDNCNDDYKECWKEVLLKDG